MHEVQFLQFPRQTLAEAKLYYADVTLTTAKPSVQDGRNEDVERGVLPTQTQLAN